MRGSKFAIGVVAMGIWGQATAQTYNVVNLGTLGGSNSEAYGLNDLGEVVGYSVFSGDPSRKAFKWTQQTGMQQLFGYQSEGEDNARGINNSGVVVGSASEGSWTTAARWTPGQFTQGISFPGNSHRGLDINDSGNVAGIYYSNLTAQGGFVMGNQAWTMPLAQNQEGSMAVKINDNNFMVGYRFSDVWEETEAVMWDPFSGVTSLIDFGGDTVANGINNQNRVTGRSNYANSDISHAYFWSQDTGMISIHTQASWESSTGEAISDDGTIVGAMYNDQALVGTAFIWTAQTGMQNIEEMLDAQSQGWRIFTARDINSHGQIIGYGHHELYGTRALLLNPVPEPTTIAALALGALALRRRRRHVK